MAASPAVAIITLLIFYVCESRCEYNATALSTQLDTLLAEYDREAAPASRVAVLASLDIRHATVLEAQSAMRLLADLKLSWVDPRIGWNASEWGTESALTAAERLWLPDVALINAAATSDAGAEGLRARLSAGGAVSWFSRLDVTAPLTMDLRNWPRDVQVCTFKFGSRTFNDDELVLNIKEIEHAIVFESGTWSVLSISGESSRWHRGEGAGAGASSVAGWTVSVARNAPAHSAAATAALLAAALMLAGAVLLPPAHRHPLAACASFTAAMWLITALARLPAAASCPRAFSVMCAVCVCGAGVGAGGALVLRVARCRAPPPRRLRALLSRLSSVCRLTPTSEECMSSCSGAWSAAALLADRALAAATLLTLLVLVAVQLS